MDSTANLHSMIQVTRISASLHECNGQLPAPDGSNCDHGNRHGCRPGEGEKAWAAM